MATTAEIQAQIDSAATTKVANIVQSRHVDATYDEHYVIGINSPYKGKARWCKSTAAETAAQQATAVLAALVA